MRDAALSEPSARAIVRDQLFASCLYEALGRIALTADSLSMAATIARAHVRLSKPETAKRYIAQVTAAIDALAELRAQIGGNV